MMKRIGCLTSALFFLTGPAYAADPTPYHAGTGIVTPIPGRPDALWSQPADLGGGRISSDSIVVYGLFSEVANDFVLDCDGPATVTHLTWWGGEYALAPGDPDITVFDIYWYDDDPAACSPQDRPFMTQLQLTPERTYLGQDQGEQSWQYDLDLTVELTGGTKYWFVVQGYHVGFPPQYGRQEAVEIIDCTGRFRSAYYGYPDWTEMNGDPFHFGDASLEIFGQCGVVPVLRTTWGGIRALYRW